MSIFLKRKIFVIGIVSLVMASWLINANTAQGITAEELLAQIADLQAQIAQLRSQLAELQPPAGIYEGIPAGFSFENNLKYEMRNNEVKYLQIILKSEGLFCLKCSATGYFGYWTKMAVIAFQKKYASEILTPLGLTKGTGFVGKATRAKLNQPLTPTTCLPSPPSMPILSLPADGSTDQSLLPTLSWQTPSSWGAGCSDNRKYRIQIDDDSQFSSPLTNAIVFSPATFYTVSSGILSYNTIYYWRVRAENNAQYSDYSTRGFRTLAQGQPDFSLSVSPNSGSVTPGSSTSTTITATLVSSPVQSVIFSVSGLPNKVSASFSQVSCSPSCSSALTILTLPDAQAGSYPITISGTGGGLTRTTLYNLVIAPASALSVSLSANPSSGSAPLNDADLTAQVSETTTGPINYTFYCNRSDSGTNITPGYAHKKDGTALNPYTVLDICDYSSAGTYTAKVIAEKGTLVAENRTAVNVVSGTCSDGTLNDQCSLTKPLSCDGGTLINKCSLCGCPVGQTCQADETCKQQLIVKSVVLIDSRLYSLIKTDLDQYINHAEGRRNFDIVIDNIDSIDNWSYSQVKSHIQNLKNSYPELEGILLVGNIKIPSFYKPRGDNLQVRLFTQYYADLDGTFSRLYAPGSIDPKCPTNDPYCNVWGDNIVPNHDFDHMVKGTNPDPELWIALLPVGFSTPAKNTYANYANQLKPFFTKVMKYYRGELTPSKKMYQVSNQLWYMPEVWNYYGPSNIDFYSVNSFYTKEEKPSGLASNQYCTVPKGAVACYVRAPMENYPTFQAFWDYYQTRAWMGEDWQTASVYKNHMANNNYEFVWVNTHASGTWSVVSSSEAKTLTNGGLVMLGSGCSVAEFFQPSSPSYVDSGVAPDDNLLVSYIYGTSNFIAAMGDPFNRGHGSYDEKLIPFMNQGDYLGKAFLKRWQIQYQNSPNPLDLGENSQEMLIGNPFLDI
jgi:peptidoglycan hydrolase-like protein with peptidoglycan-binding domain